MLQQTQVQTVVPYYLRWMERFPTATALADATEEEVLQMWQGLGYYSRARSLHRLVRHVMSNLGGVFPLSEAEWRELPGVGPYTAAAILAFAFDKPAAVVDANIARVLTRWANYNEAIDTAPGRLWLASAAEALQPAGHGEKNGAATWNSAVMELGALICRAGVPDCLLCPVKEFCRARKAHIEKDLSDIANLPKKKPRPPITFVTEHRALWVREGYLQAELSAGPRWRGLHILPECVPPNEEPLLEITYGITRYRVNLQVHFFAQSEHKSEPRWLRTPPPLRSLPVQEWAAWAWAAPHRRAVARGLELVHTLTL